MAFDKRVERRERARARLFVAEQAPVVMHHQRDAEHFEGDLLGIGARRELSFLERLLHRALERVDPGALASGEHVAHRAGLVVKFGRAADHRAAAGQVRRFGPVEPVDEHRLQARYAARFPERGFQHDFGEFLLAVIQHRQQQFFARAEVRKQPRLRQVGRLRQRADRQSVKTGLADEPQRLVEDGCPGPLALG